MHQLSLMEPAPLYVVGSRTSKEAAEKILGKAGSLRHRVYLRIVMAGAFGCTDEQIQLAEGMDPSTERPRRIELLRAGLIRDSGRERKTRSGRNAVIWVAV